MPRGCKAVEQAVVRCQAVEQAVVRYRAIEQAVVRAIVRAVVGAVGMLRGCEVVE